MYCANVLRMLLNTDNFLLSVLEESFLILLIKGYTRPVERMVETTGEDGHQVVRSCFLRNINVPLLLVMKGSYFGFGSPQQQVDMHARSENTFIFL